MDDIKQIRIETETVIDESTGEVRSISTKKINILVDPDEFALIYAKLWDVIMGSNLSKSDIELAAYIFQRYADGQSFTITSYLKKQVAERSNKKPTSYNNSTRALINSKIIYSVEGNNYKVNPRYAFQGSSHNRHKAVIEMSHTCKDC